MLFHSYTYGYRYSIAYYISIGHSSPREIHKKDQMSHRSCPRVYYPKPIILRKRHTHRADSAVSLYSWWKALITSQLLCIQINRAMGAARERALLVKEGTAQLLQNNPYLIVSQPQAMLLLRTLQRWWHINTWEPQKAVFYLAYTIMWFFFFSPLKLFLQQNIVGGKEGKKKKAGIFLTLQETRLTVFLGLSVTVPSSRYCWPVLWNGAGKKLQARTAAGTGSLVVQQDCPSLAQTWA